MTDYHNDHVHYSIPVASRGEYVLTATQMYDLAITAKQWMNILGLRYSEDQPKVRRRQTW